ncbi:O-antigen ligase family protein [Desulfosarcina sp. OttesenSCG-928-G10]|nr:O-antigen ligase family protein [Desulfosarcina sp. OttesenSCG-928-G10]
MHGFAVFSINFLVLTALGRVQELFPVLYPLQLGKVAVAIGLITLLSINSGRLTVFLKATPMGRCLFIIFILSFMGIPFSVYVSGAIESFFGFCRAFLIVSILVGLSMDGREQALYKACIWTLLIMSVLMMMERGGGRIQISNTYDPNDMALLFVMYLPIIANEALLGGKWIKIMAVTACICSVMAIPLTGSRGGIIALSGIGLHAVLLAKRQRWILIPVLALVAFVISVTADDSLWDRFQSVQDNTDYNFDSKEGRVTVWKEGLRIMITRPLFGVGIGQFSVGLGTLGNGAWKAAHNSFVQIGTELGLIGLGAFVVMLYSVYRVGKRGARASWLPPDERQRFMAFQISLTGYCIGGFFLSQAYGFILLIFLVLVACMYLKLKAAEQRSVREGDFADEDAGKMGMFQARSDR